MIGNLDTFSGALARNSDRLDGIVAGLERMTGGATAKARLVSYDLTVPRVPETDGKAIAAQLVVADPTALGSIGQRAYPDRIGKRRPCERARRAMERYAAEAVAGEDYRSLEDANAFAGISRPMDAVNADFQLLVDVRTFRLVSSPAGTAEVDLAGKILDAKGRIVATRVFAELMRVSDEATAAAIAALDRAFAKAGSELITWAVRTMSDQSNAPKPTVPKKAEIRNVSPGTSNRTPTSPRVTYVSIRHPGSRGPSAEAIRYPRTLIAQGPGSR